jgi:Peroxiredoxin
MKLQKGSIIQDFTFDTPFEKGVSLYAKTEGKPTFLMFLRYYGCTVCQVDMHHLQAKYKEFEEKGAKVLVVLQSKPELIAEQITKETFAFDIVCDPEQKLYKEFEIMPAKSKLGMVSTGLFSKMKEAKALGLEHGEYEGDEQQLPALFLLGNSGEIMYAHYAKNLTDMPTLDAMLNLVP